MKYRNIYSKRYSQRFLCNCQSMCNLLSFCKCIFLCVCLCECLCLCVCANGNNHKKPSNALFLFSRIEAIMLKGKTKFEEENSVLACDYFAITFHYFTLFQWLFTLGTHTHTQTHAHSYAHRHTWEREREKNQQISAAYFRARELLILVFPSTSCLCLPCMCVYLCVCQCECVSNLVSVWATLLLLIELGKRQKQYTWYFDFTLHFFSRDLLFSPLLLLFYTETIFISIFVDSHLK